MKWVPRLPARVAGLALAASAAALWAIGGIAAQELFTHHHIDPGWLVGIRLSCGGVLLLAAFRPAWPGRHAVRLFAVAFIGIAGAQFTWFVAIKYSNVALATFVQYSAVGITAAWQLLRRQVRITLARLAALASAGTGVWLLVAGAPGGLHTSHAGRLGIIFALVSAAAYSFYLLSSGRLVQEIGPRAATAWGLTLASVPVLGLNPPWAVRPAGDLAVVAALTAVVAVAATAIAFSLSFASLSRITPTEFAVTSTLEPALAAVAAAALLGVTLRPPQYLGGVLTVVAVLLLARGHTPRSGGGDGQVLRRSSGQPAAPGDRPDRGHRPRRRRDRVPD